MLNRIVIPTGATRMGRAVEGPAVSQLSSKFVAHAARAALSCLFATATASAAPCSIQPVVFEGWQAEQITNDWLQLTLVPQLGGRLMQVSFNGHPYLFINPVYEGKYISPAQAAGEWINYGGDKIWPLPEGEQDEQHWQGASTPLDDGPYAFSILAQDEKCIVRLAGPPDPPTGLQYTREISIGNDSPQIFFHATMKNFTGHGIHWAVQSVSQYNLSDAKDPAHYNHDFHAYTPLNPHSAYLLGYHARDGLANDPAYGVENGLFHLNWKYLESEVWLDSTAGWLAVVDGATQYAMVEKTKHIDGGDYPEKATTIFYKNGPTVRLDAKGMPHLSSMDLKQTPYYMEAEINSPMVLLNAGETYSFDTTWLPARSAGGFATVTDSGLVAKPFTVRRTGDNLVLSGSFGVFFPGELKAFLYDQGGVGTDQVTLQTVRPQDAVVLNQTIPATKHVARVSIHLIDSKGVDRGPLGEAFATMNEEGH